eukprot:UN03979
MEHEGKADVTNSQKDNALEMENKQLKEQLTKIENENKELKEKSAQPKYGRNDSYTGKNDPTVRGKPPKDDFVDKNGFVVVQK